MSAFKVLDGLVDALPLTAIAGVTGYTVWKIVKDTFLAEHYCKKRAVGGVLDDQFDAVTQKAIDQVTDKFLPKLSAKQLALTTFYWSSEPSIDHVGSTKTRHGAFIGIPEYYKFQSMAEVDLAILQLDTDVNKVDPVLLQNLRDSLVLSENAKKFAIASELHFANTVEIALKTDPMFMMFGAVAMGKFLFVSRIQTMSIAAKFFAFVGITFIWTVMHYVVAAFFMIMLQGVADRKAADFGEDYLTGGIEFLSKLETKNKALGKLGWNSQKYAVDETGNMTLKGLNVQKMPVTERKRCLLEYEKQLKIKEAKDNS